MKTPQPARRVTNAVIAIAAWYVVSCTEVPAPEGGVASISNIRRPSPGLVVGDTMRDSTGVVAPLQVISFGLDDAPLDPQPTPSFVVLDTTAHIVAGRLIGDRVGTVRVVGVVGSLQTRPDTIPITLSPDTLVPSDSVVHRKSYALAGDTVVNSAELGAFVQHLLPTVSGVQAVVVKYTIVKAPQGKSSPTAVLMTNNRASDRDTSDASGKVSRVARLRLNALESFRTDTVMVNAAASYRGRPLGVVTFTVVFTRQ
jgi:hypothetical protein